ncbi:MAG: hypothetical protein ACI31R_06270 [Bacilli bacterium]
MLPDLDVPNIKQLTYDELVHDYIKEKFTYLSSENNLIKSISDEEQLIFEKLKTSMLYKHALDNFMDDFMNSVFGGHDFIINDYKIIEGSIIKKFYEETKDNFLYKESYKKKIDRVMLLMSHYIENHQEEINLYVWREYLKKMDNLTVEDKIKEKEKYQKTKKEIEKNCKTSIRKYFSKSSPKTISLYLEFLNMIPKYIDMNSYNIKASLEENIKKC